MTTDLMVQFLLWPIFKMALAFQFAPSFDVDAQVSGYEYAATLLTGFSDVKISFYLSLSVIGAHVSELFAASVV